MNKLEKKLKELGFELSRVDKIFIPKLSTLKYYSKKVSDNQFNYITISEDGIFDIVASNEEIMQKDLEVLKQL